jgi:hypothetical protein
MRRFLLALALLIALPRAARAVVTCSGVCVQATAAATCTGSNTCTATFGSPTTSGNTVLVYISSNAGGTAGPSTGTFSGQNTNWVQSGDSGGSSSTGNRVFVYCATVGTAGATVAWTNQGATSYFAAYEYNEPETCSKVSIITLNNGSTGATSVTVGPITSLASTDLVTFVGTHRTSEAVTDASTNMTASQSSATNPTLGIDYAAGAVTATGKLTWTTSSAFAGLIVWFNQSCAGIDSCVQQTPYHSATASADNQVTFTANVTKGHIILATINLTTGNSTALPKPSAGGTDLSASWVSSAIEDTGSAGSNGRRIITFCGYVTGAGTTMSITNITGGSYATAKEVSGYLCVVDGTASTTNSGTGTVSSVTPTGIPTTNAKDFILANVLFNGGGGVITDSSTGFTSAGIGTAGPTVTSDYQSVTSTGTYGGSWAIGSAAVAAGGQVALEAGTLPGQMVTAPVQVFALATPVVIPTPAPPNLGVYESFNQRAIPSSYHVLANTQGPQFNVPWGQLEPADCTGKAATDPCWNWAPIDTILAKLNTNQYAQIMICTGQQSPTSVNSFGGHTWLKDAGITGVNALWTNATPPTNPNLVKCSATTFEPNPADSTYQTKLVGLATAIDSKYGGNAKIALITIAPSSDVCYDVAMTSGAAHSCATGNPNYVTEWNAVSMAQGGCTSGDETCWHNYIIPAMETLYNNITSAMPDINQAQWIQHDQNFGVVNSSYAAGGDPAFNLALWPYFGQHPPASAKEYIAQEALNCKGFGAVTLMAPYVQYFSGMGAQASGPFNGSCSGVNQCTDLCWAGILSGSNQGILWQQQYNQPVAACPTSVAEIASAIAAYPAQGTCP